MYNDIVQSIAKAIADMEGFTDGTSKIARINNNPGNIRNWVPGKDVKRGGFVVFSSLDEGWRALNKVVSDYIKGDKRYFPTGKSPTLEEAFARYAPAKDNNDPVRYAQVVSAKTGIPLGVPLQDYINGTWAGSELFQVDPVATQIRNTTGGSEVGSGQLWMVGGLALLATLAVIALVD